MPPAARCPARPARRSGIRCATRSPFMVGLNCALGASELRPYVERALARRRHRRVRASERGPAERIRRVRRDARGDGRGHRASSPRAASSTWSAAAAARRPEHIRALRAATAGIAPRVVADAAAALPPVRPRAAQHRPRRPVRQRRRAHQRHRLGAVPQADRGGRLRRRGAGRAPAGRRRRADHRRQHGRGHARFATRRCRPS